VRKLEKHAADSAAMGAHAISALSPTAVGASDTANRENADLDKRYGTGGEGVANAGAAATGWRASVAMYRAERDARSWSGSSGRPGPGRGPSPAAPAVPQAAGSNVKIVRPAVLHGTAGLTEAARRRMIEENLAASVDPSQLLYVSAHGTLFPR
jgi:hypothetical protein